MANAINPTSTSEESVYDRYASAAQAVEPALCCPVDYNADYLTIIPDEIIERDYGCGDPSAYVHAGETVLDLGSGGGKLCFIAAQVVGETGKVIGVDCNREMLDLATKHAPTVTERMGYANIDFRYGMIQDLQLDLARLDDALRDEPVSGASGFLRLRNLEEQLRREHPLVEDESIDCVVSNCVLNLVRNQDRKQLLDEIFRVLKKGGRAAISDIVCDEVVPEHLQKDPTLWSGCLSGAFGESEFLEAFEDAGFHGIEIVKRQVEPWQIVEGIEFRSMTVVAYKGKQGPCLDRNQAVVYRGPFKSILDDDGHEYFRGQRVAVCDKTFSLLHQAPYAGLFESIQPATEIPLSVAKQMDCRSDSIRPPKETKGAGFDLTVLNDADCCSPNEDCC
jgi:SAM-dependent methyltransferase